MEIKLLTWTGNGVNGRTLTDVGFRSDFILLKRQSGVSGGGGLLWTSTMTGAETKNMGGGLSTGYISAATADGFTVGNHQKVNQSGATYHALCIRGHVSDMQVGTYVGNGNDGRTLAVLDFQPAVVIIMPDSTAHATFRCDTHSGDETSYFTNTANSTNHIQSLVSNGWTLGSAGSVNANGTTYHYAAWKEVTGFSKTIGYTGSGSDDRQITGTGFQPDSVVLKGNGTIWGHWHPVTIGATTDLSITFQGTGSAVANVIQELLSSGYEVGNSSASNSNGVLYRGFKLKEGNTVSAGGGGGAGVRRQNVTIL